MINCDLGLEIVSRAVMDWRLLIQAKAWKRKNLYPAQGGVEKLPSYRCNFGELRRFFTGDWCEMILVGAGVSTTKEKILDVLERELGEAILKDEMKEARKRGQKTM